MDVAVLVAVVVAVEVAVDVTVPVSVEVVVAVAVDGGVVVAEGVTQLSTVGLAPEVSAPAEP